MIRISESPDEVIFMLDSGIRFKVSPEDQRFVIGLSWNVHKPGAKYQYIQCKTSGQFFGKLLHCLLCPSIDEVDHWDHDTFNNRRDNLRSATKSQNQHNALRREDNSSGIKGVTFHKATQKYYARIQVNKKRIDLGCFNTLGEAAKAYSDAAIKYHREFHNNG